MPAAGAGRGGAFAVLAAATGSPYFFWLVLALPAAVQTARYWQGAVFYGEYLHWTGQFAAQLLIATMAVTPLRLAFPAARGLQWLARRRRYLGVATFGYALLHTLAYLERADDWSKVVDEALGIAIGTGWIALVIFLLLAATSNDVSVRGLGRGWKRLHRTIHVAALLTFAHWILTAFDPLAGWLHLAVLALLESFRVWKSRQPSTRRRPF